MNKITIAVPRPLPVINLVDMSVSKGDRGKIEALNASLKDMITTFDKESRLCSAIQVDAFSIASSR